MYVSHELNVCKQFSNFIGTQVDLSISFDKNRSDDKMRILLLLLFVRQSQFKTVTFLEKQKGVKPNTILFYFFSFYVH